MILTEGNASIENLKLYLNNPFPLCTETRRILLNELLIFNTQDKDLRKLHLKSILGEDLNAIKPFHELIMFLDMCSTYLSLGDKEITTIINIDDDLKEATKKIRNQFWKTKDLSFLSRYGVLLYEYDSEYIISKLFETVADYNLELYKTIIDKLKSLNRMPDLKNIRFYDHKIELKQLSDHIRS